MVSTLHLKPWVSCCGIESSKGWELFSLVSWSYYVSFKWLANLTISLGLNKYHLFDWDHSIDLIHLKISTEVVSFDEETRFEVGCVNIHITILNEIKINNTNIIYSAESRQTLSVPHKYPFWELKWRNARTKWPTIKTDHNINVIRL